MLQKEISEEPLWRKSVFLTSGTGCRLHIINTTWFQGFAVSFLGLGIASKSKPRWHGADVNFGPVATRELKPSTERVFNIGDGIAFYLICDGPPWDSDFPTSTQRGKHARHSVSNNLALFLPVCILCLGPKQYAGSWSRSDPSLIFLPLVLR